MDKILKTSQILAVLGILIIGTISAGYPFFVEWKNPGTSKHMFFSKINSLSSRYMKVKEEFEAANIDYLSRKFLSGNSEQVSLPGNKSDWNETQSYAFGPFYASKVIEDMETYIKSGSQTASMEYSIPFPVIPIYGFSMSGNRADVLLKSPQSGKTETWIWKKDSNGDWLSESKMPVGFIAGTAKFEKETNFFELVKVENPLAKKKYVFDPNTILAFAIDKNIVEKLAAEADKNQQLEEDELSRRLREMKEMGKEN